MTITKIRNRFGLWEGNPHLILDCAKDAGKDIQYADEASAVILGRLALELEKTQVGIEDIRSPDIKALRASQMHF